MSRRRAAPRQVPRGLLLRRLAVPANLSSLRAESASTGSSSAPAIRSSDSARSRSGARDSLVCGTSTRACRSMTPPCRQLRRDDGDDRPPPRVGQVATMRLLISRARDRGRCCMAGGIERQQRARRARSRYAGTAIANLDARSARARRRPVRSPRPGRRPRGRLHQIDQHLLDLGPVEPARRRRQRCRPRGNSNGGPARRGRPGRPRPVAAAAREAAIAVDEIARWRAPLDRVRPRCRAIEVAGGQFAPGMASERIGASELLSSWLMTRITFFRWPLTTTVRGSGMTRNMRWARPAADVRRER